MLSTAPLHYGLGGQFGLAVAQSSDSGDSILGRMSKRRRVDDGANAQGGRTPYDQWQQQSYGSASAGSPYGGSNASVYGGAEQHDMSTVPAYTHSTPGGQQQAQWQQTYATTTPDGYIPPNPYQDLSAFHQPYFYGQTDPSVYNSPWPPQQQQQPPPPPQPQPQQREVQDPQMPYMPPTQPTVESNDSFSNHATPDYAAALQNFDISSFGFEHHRAPQSQQQRPQQQRPQQQQLRPGLNAATYMEDASMHLKMQSLSILDNLATQLIHTIAKYSFAQVQELMQKSDDEESQAYITLKNLFDQTRKVYSRETAFIDAIAIQMFQPNQQEIIRKANIATFVSAILGAHDVSFFHLNEFFLETFVPLGHRLLKWQGAIYLELKTQTYISALINSDGSQEAMLDELFPQDLDSRILTRHPDAPSLSPSEQDFIDRSRARRAYLLAEPAIDDALRELPKKYQWNDFVREFAGCISKNVDSIMSIPTRAQPVFGGTGERRAAQAQALQDSMNLMNSQAQRRSTPPGAGLVLRQQSSQPPTSQPSTGKSATPSTTVRQPWLKPEEDALVAGLEKVNGPHWSQILALYGRGGSISEVLKDRNQVQLKDKARNLKLWYLKTGREVPVSLRGVTGELRKRGGARARAALAAEESAEGGDDAAEASSEGRITPVAKKKGKGRA